MKRTVRILMIVACLAIVMSASVMAAPPENGGDVRPPTNPTTPPDPEPVTPPTEPTPPDPQPPVVFPEWMPAGAYEAYVLVDGGYEPGPNANFVFQNSVIHDYAEPTPNQHAIVTGWINNIIFFNFYEVIQPHNEGTPFHEGFTAEVQRDPSDQFSILVTVYLNQEVNLELAYMFLGVAEPGDNGTIASPITGGDPVPPVTGKDPATDPKASEGTVSTTTGEKIVGSAGGTTSGSSGSKIREVEKVGTAMNFEVEK